MEEKLATHEEEGEVVQEPAHEEKAAQGVIFDNFSCRKQSKLQHLEQNQKGSLLFSKSL
jgi:hypothetical protein